MNIILKKNGFHHLSDVDGVRWIEWAVCWWS